MYMYISQAASSRMRDARRTMVAWRPARAASPAGVGLDAGAAKGARWVRVRLAPGTFFDVFNCHLQAQASETQTLLSAEELLALRCEKKLWRATLPGSL